MSDMVTVEVSVLEGPALDWAVAKCEGGTIRTENGIFLNQGDGYDYFTPSTNWEQGGPIIDREITGLDLVSTWKGAKKWSARRFEYLPDDQTRCNEASGPTPLVAAMRCYVTSRFGNTMEIPATLMPMLPAGKRARP